MTMTTTTTPTPARLQDVAERALAAMRTQGFEHAQVTAGITVQDELNIAHNTPSLMRSGETERLGLVGIVDGRRASTELGRFADMAEGIASLYASATSAPQDEANAVSSGQHARIVQGPQRGDTDLIATKVEELLAYRAQATPKMMLDESTAAHTQSTSQTLTTGGSDLRCEIGWYSMSIFGTAREGKASSSFNFTYGNGHDLGERSVAELFGIGRMLADTERQIHTAPLLDKFEGDVVLAPQAVAALLSWLMSQLADQALIGKSSLYRESLGQAIASPLVSLKSRFDAPGVAALSSDGFVAKPVEIVAGGTLRNLTPSLYGSRKTGLAHVPTAGSGWDMPAGETPLDTMLADVPRGALVGRLSMGTPASNGDFSSVIKNSFVIRDGEVGQALSGAMISGNVAQMLKNVVAVSRERIDTGGLVLPWLRVHGLHFS
jgi:PmbA protein